MIDRHDTRPGQKVWALLNETESVFSTLVPRKVLFDRLQPYQGFSYHDTVTGEWSETRCEAIFAETKAELLEHHVAKLEQKISDIREEQDRLRSLAGTP